MLARRTRFDSWKPSSLAAAGFAHVQAKDTGRPGYLPADLNRIRSSRRLEAETRRTIEVIWLRQHLKPDFKTIADFRRDNRKAFRPVFRQFVLLCKPLDLFGRELRAVDGAGIKAVNNKDRNCGYQGPREGRHGAVCSAPAARSLGERPSVSQGRVRRESVEHPFSTIKQWMYQGAFLMRS